MTKWPQPFLLKKQLTCCWTSRRHLRCGETDTSSLSKICWAHSSFPPQQVFWDKVYKPPEAFKENKAGLPDERHCQASKCFERTYSNNAAKALLKDKIEQAQALGKEAGNDVSESKIDSLSETAA